VDLLILGGTRFLGRHLVGEALERGHRVTLFNRGKSGPGLFPEVEELPFWVPREMAGILSVDVGRAVGTGLVFRPLAETVRDVPGPDAGSSPDVEIKAGIPREREEELLRAWRGSSL